MLPAQQGCPAPPQDWQIPTPPHTEPAPQVLPAQQGCPGAPQVAQVVPPWQTFPAAQLPLLQHACPAAPQGAQRWSRPHWSPVPQAGLER